MIIINVLMHFLDLRSFLEDIHSNDWRKMGQGRRTKTMGRGREGEEGMGSRVEVEKVRRQREGEEGGWKESRVEERRMGNERGEGKGGGWGVERTGRSGDMEVGR